MRAITPVQQTNEPILSNFISITPSAEGDVIYFRWTLFHDSLYVNNGSMVIHSDDLVLYNNDEDWMYDYVAKELGLTFI